MDKHLLREAYRGDSFKRGFQVVRAKVERPLGSAAECPPQAWARVLMATVLGPLLGTLQIVLSPHSNSVRWVLVMVWIVTVSPKPVCEKLGLCGRVLLGDGGPEEGPVGGRETPGACL